MLNYKNDTDILYCGHTCTLKEINNMIFIQMLRHEKNGLQNPVKTFRLDEQNENIYSQT